MIAVDTLLNDHQPLHSDLQIDAWIVNRDNWTPWGKYQQALRELHGRRSTIESLTHEIAVAELDLNDLANRAPWFGTARRKRWSLAFDQQLRKLRDLRASLAECRREFSRFHAIASTLKEELGEIDPERRAQLDRETWTMRMRMMLALDLAANGRVSASLLGMLAAAPETIRKSLACEMREPSRLLALLE